MSIVGGGWDGAYEWAASRTSYNNAADFATWFAAYKTGNDYRRPFQAWSKMRLEQGIAEPDAEIAKLQETSASMKERLARLDDVTEGG